MHMSIFEQWSLKGRVALVTGGSRGLGLQIAEGLGEAGAAVVIASRTAHELEEGAARLRSRDITTHTVQGDISRPEDAQRWMEEIRRVHGRLDILVNNAAILSQAPAEQMPLEEFSRVVNTNLGGAFNVSQAAARAFFIPQRDGRIINISAVGGLMTIHSDGWRATAYSAAKAGMNHMTRTLAIEWSAHNIRVNCVCPGIFPSRMSREPLEKAGDAFIQATPLKRLGNEHDLKGICVLFASDASSFITGQVIAVDGGLSV
jgi:gluconate 5-dehydrogenase